MVVDLKGWIWICQVQFLGLFSFEFDGSVKVYQEQENGWLDNFEVFFFNFQDSQLYFGGISVDYLFFWFDEVQGCFLLVEGQFDVDKE